MRAPADRAEAVRARADAAFDDTVALLSEYLAIPAISCDPDHFDDVRALASRISGDLVELGLDNVRILEIPDTLPCVAAEWLHAGPDAPTVLIYGHLDLQPVKGEPWVTPPHEAVQKDDGRLYARGSADDMGGWVSHLAAVKAWLAETGGLPCNLKLLIEGEEEIGSPNLERYMDTYKEAFEADVMVLTDCENPSTEIPGLTTSLRGLMELELTVEALSADGHSGLWGNMVPDVSIALCRLIARLTDDDGRLKLGRVEVPKDWARESWDVPLDDAVIADGAHIVDGVKPLPARGRSPAEWMWRQPAITVVATTLPTPDMKKNALRTKASAILSVRIAPGQTGEELGRLIEAELMAAPPGGVKVSLDSKGWDGESWLYEPKGPAFEAADRAYQKVWGRKLLRIGVGGSIPFVALFGRKYGDLPLILNGVMDPKTTAHGPNESMHLGIFRKAIASNVELYAELGGLTLPELAPQGLAQDASSTPTVTATAQRAPSTVPATAAPAQHGIIKSGFKKRPVSGGYRWKPIARVDTDIVGVGARIERIGPGNHDDPAHPSMPYRLVPGGPLQPGEFWIRGAEEYACVDSDVLVQLATIEAGGHPHPVTQEQDPDS